MPPRVLTGSKDEIAQKIAALKAEILQVIVFMDDPAMAGAAALANNSGAQQDIFAEMEPFTVNQSHVDDSREAIYRQAAGE